MFPLMSWNWYALWWAKRNAVSTYYVKITVGCFWRLRVTINVIDKKRLSLYN